MGVRETINRNPQLSVILLGTVIAASAVYAAISLRSDASPRVTQAYYTVDDGKTWFADSMDRIPPFEVGGKPAVRAKVFVCLNDNSKFVGYLEQYSSEYKKRLDESAASMKAGSPPKLSMNSAEVVMRGVEVKKPGDAKWVSATDPIGKSKVTNVVCPSGGAIDSVVP